MTARKRTRRHLLAGLAAMAGSGTIARTASALTPRAGEGPFYPRPSMRMPDTDNDLVKVAGGIEQAGGEVFLLRGRITDRNGRPRAGLRIEIWQCDVNGKYLHPGDRRNIAYDRAFQGFGHDITDAAGRYVFRTIKPTIYPGRTPHIHVKVLDGQRDVFTTQFYIKDHPGNARDSLYNRMSRSEADAVSMVFVSGSSGTEAMVDVVI